MNDSQKNRDGMHGSEDSLGGQPATKRRGRWRAVLRVLVTAIVGFLAIATVHEMVYEPTPSDGTYEWTLHWPGTPPGAKFTTERGDDTRRMLEILIADAGADWQTPLAKEGTVDVELRHPAYPSLWSILKWRLGLLKGPQSLAAQRTLIVVRINEVDGQPPRYELIRIESGGREVVSGSFDDYEGVENAALDVLARAMDDYQT